MTAYRDMTEGQRLAWGAQERAARIRDLEDRSATGLEKAQLAAKGRRQLIDASESAASRMVADAGRAQRVAEAATESRRYANAMMANDLTTLVAIEQKHGLYGYAPEVVSVGLAAFDRGEDVATAVDRYLGNDEEEF